MDDLSLEEDEDDDNLELDLLERVLDLGSDGILTSCLFFES